jgi:hypothetical protein
LGETIRKITPIANNNMVIVSHRKLLSTFSLNRIEFSCIAFSPLKFLNTLKNLSSPIKGTRGYYTHDATLVD